MANRNRRNPDVGDFDPQAQIGQPLPTAVAGDSAAPFAAAGSALARTAQKLGERADAATRIEAKREGAIAGAEPGFRPTGGTTIAEATYDQAATATYVDRLDAKVSRETREAYQAWSADPNRQPSQLTARLDEIRDAILKDDVFPEIRGQVEARFERLRLPFETQAGNDQLERQRDAARAAGVEKLAEIQTANARVIAAAGGNVAAVEGSVRQQINDGRAVYDRMAKEGTITQEAAAKGKIALERDARMRLGVTAVENLKSVADVDASEKTLDKDFAAGKLPGMNDDAYDAVKKAHEQRRRQLVTQGSADASLITKRLDSLVDREKQGLAIPAQELEELRVAAGRSAEGQAAFDLMERKREMARRLRGFAPEEIEATAKMMRDQLRVSGGTASRAQNDLIGFVEGMAADKRKALATDPLGEADRTGLLKVAPLDVSNTEQLEIGTARRVAEARAVARSNGREPVYFQPGEIDRVKAIVAEGGDRALTTIANMVKGAGTEAPRLLAEIGNGAPELAHAGNLLRANIPQQRDLARDALEGVRLKAQPGAKLPNIPLADDDEAFREVFGGSLADQPEDRERIRATARSVFSARAARTNLDPKSSEAGDLMRQIYREVGGRVKIGREEYGGVEGYRPTWLSSRVSVVLPQEVKAGRLGDVLGAISDADLAGLPGGGPVGADGKPLKASVIARSYPVRTTAGWRFAASADETDRKWLRGSNGAIWTLDLDTLAPRLRSRVPEAFLGGRK
jgi:hypothetical protein